MLNCKDATRLISDSLETKLSVRQRMGLLFHIVLCGMCRRFRSNITKLRIRIRKSRGQLSQINVGSTPMPPETKTRLEEVIKRHLP